MDFIHTGGKRNTGQPHAAEVVAVGAAAAAEQFKRQAEFFWLLPLQIQRRGHLR